VRRFARPLGIYLDNWKGRIIELKSSPGDDPPFWENLATKP
jgi:hypothetical protein